MSIFSFKGRIGRLKYLAWMACLGVAYSILKTILTNDIAYRCTGEFNLNSTIVFCVVGITLLILLSTIPVCQRLHDLNVSGKWGFLWSIFALARIISIFGSYEINYIIHIFTFPISLIFGIILLFSRGSDTDGKDTSVCPSGQNKIDPPLPGILQGQTDAPFPTENRYGEKSIKRRSKKAKNQTSVLIVGIIIGVSTLVAFCLCLSPESFGLQYHIFPGIIGIVLSSSMLYYLIKTKFGAKTYLQHEIKKIEHEIKKTQLMNENFRLKKELDKLC